MTFKRGIYFLTVLGCALAQYFDPCSKTDNGCVSLATAKFLKASRNGIDGTEIKAIDPFIKQSLSFELEGPSKFGVHMNDIYVSGFKEQQDMDFNLNEHDKSVSMKRKLSLNIVTDIKLSKESEEYGGRYLALVNAYATTKYNYSILKNPKDNLNYFNLGKENTVFEIIGEPTVLFIEDFVDQGVNSRNIKSDYTSNKLRYDKDMITAVMKVGHEKIIENLRELTKIIPATAFFKDL